MNSVVWFCVLLLASVIAAFTWRRELAGPLIAAAVCFFISFSGLSLGIQALIFATITVAWVFGSLKIGKNTKQADKESEPSENG